MLLKVDATAEKFVVKSKLSAHAIRNTETMKITTYMMR